jgi:hypothetical protein
MPLALARIGPNLALLTLITVGLVEVDPAGDEDVVVGAAADDGVPGGWVAVEEWLDVPPPQAARSIAPAARSRVPVAIDARWPPASRVRSWLQLNNFTGHLPTP